MNIYRNHRMKYVYVLHNFGFYELLYCNDVVSIRISLRSYIHVHILGIRIQIFAHRLATLTEIFIVFLSLSRQSSAFHPQLNMPPSMHHIIHLPRNIL
jgi:hypothetical protein